MPALDAPMFPDFEMTTPEDPTAGVVIYRVSTCTLRPPVNNGRGQTFSFYMSISPTIASTAEERRKLAHAELMRRYLRAHPEDCAGVGTLEPCT